MASTRPRAFLDISIGTEPAGRLTFELFNDKAPRTCDNFRALCTGSHPPLTYKMSRFHRVIDEFMVQGGDITKGDGTGGDSIYGGEFEDENLHWRDIDTPGLLCMANRGKATNSSQFFVTLAPCTHLNGKHTVFGHLVSGQDTLGRIVQTPVDDSDKPTTDIIISHCGELERRKKALPDGSRLRPTKRPSYTSYASNASLDSQSSDRGRAKRRRPSPNNNPKPRSASRSRSRSGSASRHGKQPKHTRQPSQSPQPASTLQGKVSTRRRSRRSSDHSVDETLRGRQRCRPDDRMRMSPAIEEDSASPEPTNSNNNNNNNNNTRRHRSPSPSRHRDRSQSTGFRRRRSLPNHYERHRESSRTRYDREDERDDGHEMELDGASQRQVDARHGREREADSWRPSQWDKRHSREDGRLGAHGNDGHGGYGDSGSGGGGIRFKGRGSMKYRERH